MRKYKGFQISWWLIFIYAILMVASNIFIDSFFPYMNENLFNLICQSVSIIPIIYGIIFLKINFPYDKLSNMTGIRGFDITLLFIILILPISASYFISYATMPFTAFITQIFGEYDSHISVPQTMTDFIYIFLSTCIIAPFTEEFLFRGIILKLLDRYGTAVSVIISSFAFAMLHFNPSGFLSIFLLAILMCILRLGTGSLFASIAFHIVNNYVSFLTMIFEKGLVISENYIIIISIVGALLFPVLLFLFFKFYCEKFYFAGTGEKSGISVGMIFSLILFAAITFNYIIPVFY